MSDWKEGFIDAVGKVVLKKGAPANATPETVESYSGYNWDWTYGTFHNDWHKIAKHQAACEFTPSVAKDISWSEFQDTDSSNITKHGLYAIASCECGKYTDIVWLYEGTLGEVLKSLLEV